MVKDKRIIKDELKFLIKVENFLSQYKSDQLQKINSANELQENVLWKLEKYTEKEVKSMRKEIKEK